MKVTIEKTEFDQIVYPSLASISLARVYEDKRQAEAARRIQWSLLEKLEEASEAVGSGVGAMYQLSSDSYTFDLDSREAEVLLEYLKVVVLELPPARARRLEGLLARAKNGDKAYDDNGVAVDATD